MSRLLYPLSYGPLERVSRRPATPIRAGGGNRTRNSSLEGCGNTILQHPQILDQSGRPDLNRRPLRPKRSALPVCATPRRPSKYTAYAGSRQATLTGQTRRDRQTVT